MANVFFIGDLHFGHMNIRKYRHEVSSEEDNRFKIMADWNHLLSKRDIVYVLGDAIFKKEFLEDFATLPGTKYLIRGNHDQLNILDYLSVFKDVFGIIKYKEFWLSHAPIHPNELRGKCNIHGHVHYKSVDDERYVNTSVENLWKEGYQSLISLDQIRKRYI